MIHVNCYCSLNFPIILVACGRSKYRHQLWHTVCRSDMIKWKKVSYEWVVGWSGFEELWKELPISGVFVLLFVHCVIRSSEVFECTSWWTEISFKICCNCELFYNWVVFLYGYCLSVSNHCYSVVGLKQWRASHFRTQLQLAVFKLKRTVVPLHQF